MEEQKNKEGLGHMAQATQYMSIGLWRWEPDYGKAASEYEQAALAFCSAKKLEEAAEAFLKEAEAHEKNRAPLCAAMAYEQAGLYLSRSDHLQEAAQAVKHAVSRYLECGEADTAACTLRSFSQLLESQIPHQVVCLYQRASQLFEGEDRFLLALDLTGRASKLLVRHKCYRDAAISLGQEKHLYVEVESFSMCHQRALAQCLAYLCDLDFPAACKCLEDSCIYFPSFQSSSEYVAMVTLLNFYEDQDQDGVDEVCISPVFEHLDQEYREMTTVLKVPGFENLRTSILAPSTCMPLSDSKKKTASTTKKEEGEEEKMENVEEEDTKEGEKKLEDKEEEGEHGFPFSLPCTIC